MAAGDIKGAEAMVKVLTAADAATIVKGQVVCPAAAGGWEPATAGSIGKFAVATEGAAGKAKFGAVIYGRVEVGVNASANVGAFAATIPAANGTVAEAAAMGALAAPETYAKEAVQTELDKLQDPRGFVGTTMGAGVKKGTVTVFVGLVA